MRLLSSILFVAVALPLTAAAQRASPWPEADKLFRSHPLWLGSDGAFSIDLGSERVLWLFGDTFVARKAGDSRKNAAFVRNTVAIQSGYDPSHAVMKFYWQTTRGTPSEIFPSEGKIWMWPTHGIRVGCRLLVFCSRVAPESKKDSLGFKLAGWIAFLVNNPDEDPTRWTLVKAVESHGNVIMASAVLCEGGFVYIFGQSEPEHDVYLARWSIAHVQRGRFDTPEWWSGSGWQVDEANRQPLMREVGTEASVQRNPRGSGFIEVNSQGFGATDIVMRRAPQIEGPWGAPQKIYRPPESNAPDAFVYAGKSHPELKGADLVITYAANGDDQRLATDMSIYFPRFVKVDLADRAAP